LIRGGEAVFGDEGEEVVLEVGVGGVGAGQVQEGFQEGGAVIEVVARDDVLEGGLAQEFASERVVDHAGPDSPGQERSDV
jgi:hypothetical protein